MDPVAEILFDYLRDMIYDSAQAELNLKDLPDGFHDLGEGLLYLAQCITETKTLAVSLSRGDLNGKLPSPSNEIAAPLKGLHASLRHLTWQTRQVAQGDYSQHVDFMGDFADSFNTMIRQLEAQRQLNLRETFRLTQYMNLFLSNCPDIILLFDMDWRVLLTSTSYLQASGFPNADAVKGLTYRELFSSVTSEEFVEHMTALSQFAVTQKASFGMEEGIDFNQTGDTRHYIIQVTPMLDKNGIPTGIMMFFHDTTDITRARELAEASTRAKSDFLSRMSHEMRTPMNAIMGMTSVARLSDDPAHMEYCLNQVSEASEHLLGIINDILDMSKIEANKFELSPVEFGFQSMLQRVTDIISFQINERDQEFTVDIDKNIPSRLVADKQRLAQVLTNLLSNATKFTPREGKIWLSIQKTDETEGICTLRFVVKDTGIGISAEQQSRLFASFEQADGGISRKFGGTGLGLSISKRIVEMMQGRIWIKSELGQGASFHVEVKCQIGADDDRSDPLPENGMEQISEDGIFKGKKILVAEDVDMNREIVQALLEHTGIIMDFAENGQEAVQKFSASPEEYQLILMDIHMPGMDGYEATRLIRASDDPTAAAIPILAMTANVFREDVERCFAVGMNGHLGKPIDIDSVIAALREFLL